MTEWLLPARMPDQGSLGSEGEAGALAPWQEPERPGLHRSRALQSWRAALTSSLGFFFMLVFN